MEYNEVKTFSKDFMPSLFMEYGQDLVVTPTGGLTLATGTDEIRQRLSRSLLTTPLSQAQDGTYIAPEYIFAPTFGVGLRQIVGTNATPSTLALVKQKVYQAMALDPDVNQAVKPIVTVVQDQSLLYIQVNYALKTGQQQTLALQVQ